MKAMDVNADEMGTVFNILDVDKSGDVDINEFVTQMHKLRTDDSHMMLTFIKHYTKRLHDDLLMDVKRIMKDSDDNLVKALNKLDDLETKLEAKNIGRGLFAPLAGNGAAKPP